MIAVEAAGNIQIHQTSRLQLAERVADGLHRNTGAVGAAGAIKGRAHQAALAKGRNTDNLLAHGQVKTRDAVRTTQHHFAVQLDSQLRLADAAPNHPRSNHIQHRFVNSAAGRHHFQLVLAFHHAQILQHTVDGANLLKREILTQQAFPIHRRFSYFHIHNLRRFTIIGCRLTEAAHRTDIVEMGFVAGTVVAAAHPQNRVLRTKQQHALLHSAGKIIHSDFVIYRRHLPAGMRFIHGLTEGLQTLFQLAGRNRPDFIGKNSSFF